MADSHEKELEQQLNTCKKFGEKKRKKKRKVADIIYLFIHTVLVFTKGSFS